MWTALSSFIAAIRASFKASSRSVLRLTLHPSWPDRTTGQRPGGQPIAPLFTGRQPFRRAASKNLPMVSRCVSQGSTIDSSLTFRVGILSFAARLGTTPAAPIRSARHVCPRVRSDRNIPSQFRSKPFRSDPHFSLKFMRLRSGRSPPPTACDLPSIESANFVVLAHRFNPFVFNPINISNQFTID